jgi:methylation protein EvaC
MNRTRCGYCLQKVTPFLDLGETPLADAFPVSPDEVEVYYPLGLCVCEHCKLVQLTYVVNDEELYGRDYGFYTGASASHLGYWNQYADEVAGRIEVPHDGLLVEVACNDGTLLRELCVRYNAKHPVRELGVDPAKGPAQVAMGKGVTVLNESFGLASAQRIRDEHGPAHLIVANNVLAHVSDVEDFVRGLHHLLHRDGVVVLEVQYLADLLTGNMFDHVYHEHRAFFTFRTVTRCTLGLGLKPVDVQWTPAQGGTLRVYLTKGSFLYPEKTDTVKLRWESERWTEDWGIFDGFQGRVQHVQDRLLNLLDQEINVHRRVAGYAASAKSTTLLNFCHIDSSVLEYVEDTTPAKIGRFTPGTKIPIVARGDREIADTYLMLAWNYAPAVLRRFLGDNPQPSTRWIVPIPLPVVY